MSLIYENRINGCGSMVSAFKEENMFIMFGDNAPDTLKDFCYTVDVKNTNDKIRKGQYLIIDGNKYRITAVGDVAEKNLVNLGHVTISFDGSECATLPGTINVENLKMPELNIGTIIRIEE